jgi:hypothetical protein
MFKRLFRRSKKLPDKEGLYVLSWGEVSGFGTRYFSFTGTYYEILNKICMLETKGDVFTELNVERHDQHQLPRDGHWHTIAGKPQYHSWQDCPENSGVELPRQHFDPIKGYQLSWRK